MPAWHVKLSGPNRPFDTITMEGWPYMQKYSASNLLSVLLKRRASRVFTLDGRPTGTAEIQGEGIPIFVPG